MFVMRHLCRTKETTSRKWGRFFGLNAGLRKPSAGIGRCHLRSNQGGGWYSHTPSSHR